MPRPIDDLGVASMSTDSNDRQLRLGRSTARAFAVALAALMVAGVVVNRSSAALSVDGTTSGTSVASATISLNDDDQGRSLFDLSELTPVEPVIRCVEVAYAGTVVPVALSLKVEADGGLQPFLDVIIESGEGGGFESCDGFRPEGTLYQGTLARLGEVGELDVGLLVNLDQTRTFRIQFSVQDDAAAMGLEASTEFFWEAVPG